MSALCARTPNTPLWLHRERPERGGGPYAAAEKVKKQIIQLKAKIKREAVSRQMEIRQELIYLEEKLEIYMERNNIFKLLEQNYKSFESNLFRIDELFSKTLHDRAKFRAKNYIKKFCATTLLYSWKNRGRCIDVDDFLNTIATPLDPYETINLYSYLDQNRGNL